MQGQWVRVLLILIRAANYYINFALQDIAAKLAEGQFALLGPRNTYALSIMNYAFGGQSLRLGSTQHAKSSVLSYGDAEVPSDPLNGCSRTVWRNEVGIGNSDRAIELEPQA